MSSEGDVFNPRGGKVPLKAPLPLVRSPRRIAWFLTAHGYGHGVRAAALAQSLPAETEVTFYTSLPEAFFHEELKRPFRIVPCELDCGCIQPDSVAVDISATLRRYAEIEARRDELLSHWAERLQDEGADLVVGDIPPLAFPLARRAKIPSFALCNFSWADIYAPYVEAFPTYRPMLERMRRDYAQADAHLRLFPHLGDALTETVVEVGLVCREGADRRLELAKRLGLNPERKWCLVYLGNFGLDGVGWEQLAAFPDWEFLGLYALPGAPPNYHFLTKDPSLRYADLTASADLVLGKLGYNLVSECLAHRTPVLFISRNDFAEFPPLKQLLEERDLGVEIPLPELRALRLRPFLERISALRPQGVEAAGTARFLKILGF